MTQSRARTIPLDKVTKITQLTLPGEIILFVLEISPFKKVCKATTTTNKLTHSPVGHFWLRKCSRVCYSVTEQNLPIFLCKPQRIVHLIKPRACMQSSFVIWRETSRMSSALDRSLQDANSILRCSTEQLHEGNDDDFVESLSPGFLRCSGCVSTRLYSVSDHELAFLVLVYLKENNFKKTFDAFQEESHSLTASLYSYYYKSAPLHKEKPKGLWSIMSEYLSLQEEQSARNKVFAVSAPTTASHGKAKTPNVTNSLMGRKMEETLTQLSTLMADYQAARNAVVQSSDSAPLPPRTRIRKLNISRSPPKKQQKTTSQPTLQNLPQAPPVQEQIPLPVPSPIVEPTSSSNKSSKYEQTRWQLVTKQNAKVLFLNAKRCKEVANRLNS